MSTTYVVSFILLDSFFIFLLVQKSGLTFHFFTFLATLWYCVHVDPVDLICLPRSSSFLDILCSTYSWSEKWHLFHHDFWPTHMPQVLFKVQNVRETWRTISQNLWTNFPRKIEGDSPPTLFLHKIAKGGIRTANLQNVGQSWNHMTTAFPLSKICFKIVFYWFHCPIIRIW